MEQSRWLVLISAICGIVLLGMAVVVHEDSAAKEPRIDRGPQSAPGCADSEEVAFPEMEGEPPTTDGGAPSTAPGEPVPRDAWAWYRALLGRHSEEEFLAGFPSCPAELWELPDDKVMKAATDWLAWLDLLDSQATTGRRRLVVQALARARSLGEDAATSPEIESLFQARVGRLLRSEQDAETRARLIEASDTWAVRGYEPSFLEAVRERLADPNECMKARLRAVNMLQGPALSGDLRSFEAVAAIFDGPHDELQIRALASACCLLQSPRVPPGDRDQFRENLLSAVEAIPDSEYSDWTASCLSDSLVDDPPSLARAITGKGMTLRAAAAYALEKGAAVAGPEVTSALIEAARGTGPASYRRSAVEALWRVADGPEPDASRARDALESIALSDEDAELRAFASFALQAIEMASHPDGAPAGGE